MSGTVPMPDWPARPTHPSRPREAGPLVSLHGQVLIFGWGLIAPLSVLIARHFKVPPLQDWPRAPETVAAGAFGLRWAALLTAAIVLEHRGRRVPTRRAILRPAFAHRGNRQRPIPLHGETRT